MPERLIDLRSDTVTRPSPAMRRAMAEAEVGDDVFGEDPTIRALEEALAERLGKESALFVPSGTMANQIAIGLHAKPGDELICDSTSHVYVWECGGIARHWGVTTRTVNPKAALLTRSDLDGLIRPDDPHYVRTRLISLENTHNRGGGRVHPLEQIREIRDWARAHSVAMHLDGARLYNAVVKSELPAERWAKEFDTVSICFSKGLGAPVGSALAGTRDHMREAHRLRKLLGGGMRQAGILAAGALFALNHHVERLAHDHEHAQILATAIRETPGLRLECDPVETNLIWFVIDVSRGNATESAAELRSEGVLVAALGPQVLRACTHLDVSREDVQHAASVIQRVMKTRVRS
jgi:threonine aldolase